MSLTVAARHGASALPVFSTCSRANVRGFTAKYAKHCSKSVKSTSRGLTVKTRAEMEYDYDIFTIGTCAFLVLPPPNSRGCAPGRLKKALNAGAVYDTPKDHDAIRFWGAICTQ